MDSVNVTNELAKQRNRLAAERTLTSWMQNCITLIAFGFSFDRLGAALQRSRFPHFIIASDAAAMAVGLTLVGSGLVLLIAVTAAHSLTIAALDRGEVGGHAALVGRIATGAIIALGLVTLIGIAIETL